jgi:pyruvate,orthophosphate dikinase
MAVTIRKKKRSQLITTFEQGSSVGSYKQVDLLGGKGAGLCEMAKRNLPVPSGLVISTKACNQYLALKEDEREGFMDSLMKKVTAECETLFTDTDLLSIRSGAPVSMAGMMDTILNVGITQQNMQRMFTKLGGFACLDSLRRLVTMFGSVVKGNNEEPYEAICNVMVQKSKSDTFATITDLTENELFALTEAHLKLYANLNKETFPDTREEQIRQSIEAVFKSYNNERARLYRETHNLPEGMGTAVVIQKMVFGNKDSQSCSGVMFSRDPSNGNTHMVGEYVLQGQGEDVVAGKVIPEAIQDIDTQIPGMYDQLVELCETLEQVNKQVQDIEFTVESGKLYVLQTRKAKMTPKAAIRTAYQFWEEEIWNVHDLRDNLKADDFDKSAVAYADTENAPNYTGLAASSGAIVGRVCKTEAQVDQILEAGEVPIYVAKDTTPDDLHIMLKVKGILTEVGAATCHAAVVARSLNIPCIVACPEITALEDAVVVTMDGGTGEVWAATMDIAGGDLPTEATQIARLLAKEHDLTLLGDDYTQDLKECKGKVLDVTPLCMAGGLIADDYLTEMGMEYWPKPDHYETLQSLAKEGQLMVAREGNLTILPVVEFATTVEHVLTGEPRIVEQKDIVGIFGNVDLARKIMDTHMEDGKVHLAVPMTVLELVHELL